MCNGDKIFGLSILFLVELNLSILFLVELNKCFVLEIFKEILLALNQVATFFSSSFIVSKRFSTLELGIYKFVSSANVIGVSLLELLKRSFIYMRNKREPRMEFYGAPQVILRYKLTSFLPTDANRRRRFK